MSRRKLAVAIAPEPKAANDPGPPTLTLKDVYMLVGTNYEPHGRAPNANDFAIEALDDLSRTLLLLVEAIHEGVDDTESIKDVVTNAHYRALAARDILLKLNRSA